MPYIAIYFQQNAQGFQQNAQEVKN